MSRIVGVMMIERSEISATNKRFAHLLEGTWKLHLPRELAKESIFAAINAREDM